MRVLPHERSPLIDSLPKEVDQKNIYSDNGTNFVKASRALKSEFKAFLNDARSIATSKYAHQALYWYFIFGPTSACGNQELKVFGLI